MLNGAILGQRYGLGSRLRQSDYAYGGSDRVYLGNDEASGETLRSFLPGCLRRVNPWRRRKRAASVSLHGAKVGHL